MPYTLMIDVMYESEASFRMDMLDANGSPMYSFAELEDVVSFLMRLADNHPDLKRYARQVEVEGRVLERTFRNEEWKEECQRRAQRRRKHSNKSSERET